MSQNISPKLRVLALHGYTQSAEKFKEKTYPFQRRVKKYAELVFVSAPHTVQSEFVDEDKTKIEDISENFSNHLENKGNTPEDISTSEQSNQDSKDTECYAWYLREPNEDNTGYIYKGLQETLDYLEKVFEDKGPFDGVFGFSQGGCVVGLLCDMLQNNSTKKIKFDFAIMASAFKYEAGNFYQEKLVIPSLHIYGESDKQILCERSQELIKCFQEPLIAKHSGGHYVPGNTSLKKEYEAFLSQQWSRKFDKYMGQS